jgi:hypothetical protein
MGGAATAGTITIRTVQARACVRACMCVRAVGGRGKGEGVSRSGPVQSYGRPDTYATQSSSPLSPPQTICC